MSHPNPPMTSPGGPIPPGQPVPPAPSPITGGPLAAPSGPRERKVRFGHLALAVALIVVGALGTTALVTVVAADGEYLAIAQDVSYGAQISEADLVTVRIGNPPGLHPVPVGDLHRVVGNYATMPLAAGTLLTPAHVTDTPQPGQGEVRFGITMRSERLPAQPVRPGQRVLLVETESQGTPAGDAARPATRTWEATVVGVGGDGSNPGLLGGGGSRNVTFDVIVSERDAPMIASLAAGNQLSVAVLPGRPGG